MVRKTNAKKTYRKKSYRKKPLAKMVRSMVLKAQETKELTYPYNNIGSVNFSSVGYGGSSAAAGLFGAIAQGVNDGQRIGNSIYARGAYLRMVFSPGDNTNFMRLLVVQPKRGMATNILPSSITSFVSSVLSGASSSSTQWLQPVDTDRFEVLADKNIYFTWKPLDGSTTTTVAQVRFFNKFLKINRKIQWDDSGVVNNDVYFIALSDSSAVAHPGAVAGFVRVYYKDA